MPAGGYQKPSAPAPVSGPGALARRTDGGPAQPVRELPNAQYGEAAEYRTLQQSAPLAKASPAPRASGSAGAGDASLPGFGDPTAHPDQAVTHGADAGAGAGMSSLGLPSDDTADVRARLTAIYQAFPSEDLRQLIEQMDGDQ